MPKNFDFIQLLAAHIPSFSQLHAYCDKAEIFQCSFPEESATNARKALEWLVKNHLAMASATPDEHATLNDMLKAQFTSMTFYGLTGTESGLTWDETGAVSKAPKGMVITNGAYVGMD